MCHVLKSLVARKPCIVQDPVLHSVVPSDKILNCCVKVFKAAMKDYLSADSCPSVEEFLPQECSK